MHLQWREDVLLNVRLVRLRFGIQFSAKLHPCRKVLEGKKNETHRN